MVSTPFVHVLFDNPLLVPHGLEERAYQVNIARSCLERSTLVVLPTGMGKTVIALLVIAHVLKGEGRVLLLAPTKPLVEQHAAFLGEHLRADVGLMTGEVPPADREWNWHNDQAIVSTPQVVVNDLKYERGALDNFGLVVFDEAHRAVGDYAYVNLGEAYRDGDGLVMGTTASPGSDPERILEVCRNLGIEGVEIRTEYDPDVVSYIHDVKVERVRVEMHASTRRIRDLLASARDELIAKIRERGFLKDRRRTGVRDIVAVQKEIQRRLGRGEKNYHLYQAASQVAMIFKINQALERVETQGLKALRGYIQRMEEQAQEEGSSKASKSVLRLPKVREAIKLARVTLPEDAKVPKILEILEQQFSEKPDSKVIVFTHYRDTSELMVGEIRRRPWAKPFRFVGQADRGEDLGLKQKEQVELVEKFKSGEYNIMVATSVAEEGLDIPSTDLVVFYEPIPSEIRTIQRRGRTGRNRPGRVVVVVTRDSRDEAYLYSATRKEKKMHEELNRLREMLKQRILVGRPGGGFFAAPRLSDETSRYLVPQREDEVLPQGRRSRRKQAALGDFEEE